MQNNTFQLTGTDVLAGTGGGCDARLSLGPVAFFRPVTVCPVTLAVTVTAWPPATGAPLAASGLVTGEVMTVWGLVIEGALEWVWLAGVWLMVVTGDGLTGAVAMEVRGEWEGKWEGAEGESLSAAVEQEARAESDLERNGK